MRVLFLLTLFFFHFSFPAKADFCADQKIAFDVQKCSPQEINARRKANTPSDDPLSPYSNDEGQAMCDCLNDQDEVWTSQIAKEADAKVDPDKLENAYRSMIKKGLNNLITTAFNFDADLRTKYHLGKLIDEEGIAKYGKECKIDYLINGIKSLKPGTADCPASREMVADRVKAIFDRDFPSGVDNIKQDIAKKMSDASQGSCLSTQDYMNFRSTPAALSEAIKILEDSFKKDADDSFYHFRAAFENASTNNASNDKDKSKNHFSQKEALRDVLTYNPMFNLLFRDSDFYKKLKKRWMQNKSGIKKNFYLAFQDKNTLTDAYTALNSNCGDFNRDSLTFICSKEVPNLHPQTTRHYLDAALPFSMKNPKEREYVIDYNAKKMACDKKGKPYWDILAIRKMDKVWGKKRKARKFKEKEFRFFMAKAPLIANNTEDLFQKDNDVQKFSEMFCPGGEKYDPPKHDDLTTMMNHYLNKKKSEDGVDIAAILNDPEVVANTGLKIDFSSTPITFEVTKEEEKKRGDLPNISPDEWDVAAIKLMAKGLKKHEVDQLFAMMEMQTNRRWTEVEDLRHKMQLKNSDTTLTNNDLLNIINKKSNFSSDITKKVLENYSLQQKDRESKVNSIIAILNGKQNIRDTKEEADQWERNNYSFAQQQGQPPIDWGNTRSSIPEEIVATNTASPSSFLPNSSIVPISTTPAVTQAAVNATTAVSNQPIVSASGHSTGASSNTSPTPSIGSSNINNSATSEGSDDYDFLKKRIAEMESQVEEYKSNKIKRKKKSNSEDDDEFEDEEEVPKRISSNSHASGQPQHQSTGGYASHNQGADHSQGLAGGSQLPKGTSRSPASGINEALVKNSEAQVQNNVTGEVQVSALTGIGQNLPQPSNTAKKSLENYQEAQKELGLPGNIYPYAIPHEALKILGPNKLVQSIPGLKGKQFKTIEASSENGSTQYYEYTYISHPSDPSKVQEVSKILMTQTKIEKIRNHILTGSELDSLLRKSKF